MLTWFNGGANGTPGWSMPGGGVEFDKSIAEAVVREVFEETGYRIIAGHVIATHHFADGQSANRRPFRSQRLILGATIVGGELGTVEVGGTTDFARWVPIADVPHLERRKDVVDIVIKMLPLNENYRSLAVPRSGAEVRRQ